MIKTGLRWLFEATRNAFLAESSLVVDGVSATATATATGSESGTAGKPVLVTFTAGTVGTPGISYVMSVNGKTFDALPLGIASAITLAFGGGTLVLTLSGTVAEGATILWTPQTTEFAFGELAPQEQGNQGPRARIVFAPGIGPIDGKTPRKLGKIAAPRGPGAMSETNLGDLLEQFQVYVWSWDPADKSPQAQHDATLLLFSNLWSTLWTQVGSLGPDSAVTYLDDGAWQPVSTCGFGRELVTGWTVRTPLVGAEYVMTYPTGAFDDALSLPVTE